MSPPLEKPFQAMTDYSYISAQTRNAITRAHRISKQLHYTDIPPVMLTIGLAEECRETIADAVQRMGTDMTSFCTALAAAVPFNGNNSGTSIPISEELDEILSVAVSEARAAGKGAAGAIDVFRILATSAGGTKDVLLGLGCTEDGIRRAFVVHAAEVASEPEGNGSEPKNLKKYAADLTALAAEGALSSVIGRDEEIQRTMQILLRKTKNNPILVGPAGCGKTAIAEGLAHRIADGDAPPALQGCKVYSLDVSALVAGAGVQGEFEDRLKQVMKDLTEHPDIILFIDEVHLLMGAGAGGSMNAANILKPAMSRGGVRIMGATTTDEYTKFIEADKAFERRFQKITVEEPDEQECFLILKGIKSDYEAFHGVSIPDETVKAAISLSKRYLTERCLPDKAIDLLDEAASKLKLSQAGKEAGRTDAVLKEEDICNVVTLWTGIPLSHMQETEIRKISTIEEALSRRIIGQDEAVQAVSKVIRRNKMGLGDPGRPIGSFLFLGTTGVGKTALAKALAEFLFGSADMMVRIDMSEYQQEHTVSRLFGAPPGYVGYDQGGQLTEAVRHHPYSVVLLDEIEKAHTKVFETLLQVLDDGRMTDGQGRTVNFRNTIIIMTSNLAENQLHFRMSPEFLNRIDEIVRFNSLDMEAAMRICRLQMDIQVERMAAMGMSLSYDDTAIRVICQKGYSAEYGVRAVKRAIDHYVVDGIASALSQGEVSSRHPVRVTATGDSIVIENR